MSDRLVIAYYCTSHGLGHLTRALPVCQHLADSNHEVHIVTAAPTLISDSRLQHRAVALDSGSRQSDAFTVDTLASLTHFAALMERREELLHTEVAWLRATNVAIVVTDIVPLACTAAAQAGIPCLAVSNFSWEYLTSAGRHCRSIVWQIADDYAHATALLRLPGHCPMPAFRHIVDVPLIVRHAHATRDEVFHKLGLRPEQRLVVLMYGGHQAGAVHLPPDTLPSGWACVVCGGGQQPPKHLPTGFTLAPEDAYTPDLVAAADCVLGKIGYGTASECLAHATPLVYVRRESFNEEPFLRRLLQQHCASVEMKRRDFVSGTWAPCLLRALQLRVHYPNATNGAARVAELVASVARGDTCLDSSGAGAGTTRLRDTVVWGYVMQRHHTAGDQAFDVPAWYVGDDPSAAPSPTPTAPALPVMLPAVDIVAGRWQLPELAGQFPDTVTFLHELMSLDDAVDDSHAAERRAARDMFRWEDDVIVARAPGRLDVMGGIADFSGSLVLQMPLGLAAHVALQLHDVEQQPTWKHVQARHARTGARAALRLVSLHADASNRTPTFDMDLCDLLDGEGAPISYEAARARFQADPSHRWVAYIVGTLVVLQAECGVDVQHRGVSLLVSSAVPEGKGVSSSAAVEVATMAAVAAAYGVELDGRDMALLCQKVENLVVGAPCGVMDQMTSVLGEGGRLLALRCQPAQVEGQVLLPNHLRVWGIDSGIQHSVAGADYGTVRAATFMGRAMLCSNQDPACMTHGYLANVAASAFHERAPVLLPTSLLGSEFLQQQPGGHGDAVTSVIPDRQYRVRDAAAHPIEECFRARLFRQLLQNDVPDPECGQLLGELMFQSHASYGRLGLGSEGTDTLVAIVKATQEEARAQGREPVLYGARITGGGCGGTVAVLGANTPQGQAAVEEVARRYQATMGHTPLVFEGSSHGAQAFGVLRVRRRTQ